MISASCKTLAITILAVVSLLHSNTANSDEKNKAEVANRWPSFRGPFAAGVRDGVKIPDRWNFDDAESVQWQLPLRGLGHSSPIIWDDRIFVTSAVSATGNRIVQTGLFGSGEASSDRSVQEWTMTCVDRTSGKIRWEQVVAKGEPQDKRHTKASYANSTPATDGKHVVALIGSEGLHCFTVEGKRLWSKDFGRLDAGAYDIPTYEWGTGSSPIIYKETVIVQIDTQKKQFVAAFDVKTGESRWFTERDELPSWATPTIVERDGHDELVTNGSNFIRAYNPMTGVELWKLGGSSKITVPTPIVHDSLIFVCSGRHPEAPLFAIRSGAKADITLELGQASNEFVAWSQPRRGPYIATPIAYRGRLYVLNGNGVLEWFEAKTGKFLDRKRIPHRGGGFTASPVAADGRLYLSTEDGDVFVVQVEPSFEILSRNTLPEPIFATPALAGQSIYVRTTQRLIAIGKRR